MKLPDDIAELEKQLDPAARVVVAILRSSNETLLKTIEAQHEQITSLTAQIDDLRHMLFGRKSEKMPSIHGEVRRVVEEEELFGEKDENETNLKTEEEKKTARRKRARAKSEESRKQKRTLRKNLPVLTERVEVSPAQLPEGYTLDDFREIGDQSNVVRRIEHVREHLVSVEYVLQTLASKDNEHIITASAPSGVIEGGHYGAGVYANVIVSKCVDSIPLYRIEKIFERGGFAISRSTLCALFHRSAELLEPVYKRLVEIARQASYVGADETGLAMQNEGKCKKAWIWTLHCSTVIAYVFSKSRAGKVAKKLIGDTQGYLHVDGYSAYNAVCGENGRIRVACWAHARRLFFKAFKDFPDAKKMLDWIVDLYRVEYTAANQEILGTIEHLELREKLSVPILEKMKAWLDEKESMHPPKGKLGKAINYTLKRWDDLIVFTTDPMLRLDNNLSENALRIVALGRKNFLFVGHEEGGQNLAVLQTIVATCKLHGVNPYEYIKDVLIRVQTHPASSIDELLPQNWSTTVANSR